MNIYHVHPLEINVGSIVHLGKSNIPLMYIGIDDTVYMYVCIYVVSIAWENFPEKANRLQWQTKDAKV